MDGRTQRFLGIDVENVTTEEIGRFIQSPDNSRMQRKPVKHPWVLRTLARKKKGDH